MTVTQARNCNSRSKIYILFIFFIPNNDPFAFDGINSAGLYTGIIYRLKSLRADHRTHCNMIKIQETIENNFLIEITPNSSLEGERG